MGFATAIVDVLEKSGRTVCFVQQARDMAAGDAVLVLGLENWAQVSRPFLVRAGELGVRRILWSCEPLLPPDLPKSRLQDWFLQAQGLDDVRRPRVMQRFLDRFAYLGFTIQSWNLPWNRDRQFPVRQFSYAAKESRRLLRLWREGLIDTIFVSLQPRRGFLSKHGVPSLFVPIGYDPAWGKWLDAEERDIDVVFLGNETCRRRPLLREMDHALAKAGFKLHVVSRNCYGEERTQLLNRSKILLNLNSHPWESPGMRMLMAMSCKATVVSEHAEDCAPYIDGQHLLMGATRDLADLVISCLKDEALRSKVADQAYRFITEEHTLAARLIPALDLPDIAMSHKSNSG
jgi:hypothetical protein